MKQVNQSRDGYTCLFISQEPIRGRNDEVAEDAEETSLAVRLKIPATTSLGWSETMKEQVATVAGS